MCRIAQKAPAQARNRPRPLPSGAFGINKRNEALRRPKGGARREFNMSDAVTRVSVEIAGKEISLETGKLAKQASGAVFVQAGDTMVLCTATAGNVGDV